MEAALTASSGPTPLNLVSLSWSHTLKEKQELETLSI